MFKYFKTDEHGFSIMELVVATGIFSILVLATFGIFSSSLRGQRQVLAQTRLQRETQLIMETVSKKIRTSRVDYTEYETVFGSGNPIINPVQELILIDQADARVKFSYDQINQAINLQLDAGPINPMSSSDINITNLNFFIEPTTNPFATGLLPSVQPRITVVMSIQSSVGNSLAKLTVQQTIPQLGSSF